MEESRLLPPGTYKGRILDYGLSKSRADAVTVKIRFRIEDETFGAHNLNWQGSFKTEKSTEMALKALLDCGLNTRNIYEIARGKDSGTLDLNLDLELAVEHRVAENEPGTEPKTYAYVNFVNAWGGSLNNIMTEQEAIHEMRGLNIDGVLVELANKKGISLKIPTAQPSGYQAPVGIQIPQTHTMPQTHEAPQYQAPAPNYGAPAQQYNPPPPPQQQTQQQQYNPPPAHSAPHYQAPPSGHPSTDVIPF